MTLMIKRLVYLVLALNLALAGCSPQAFPDLSTPTADAGNGYPAAPSTDPEGAYPMPENASPQTGARSIFPPSAIDKDMQRGNLFIEAATLQPSAEEAGLYDLSVEGSLPTPCHQPRAQVNPPGADNQIVVDVYSVVAKDQICTQVIKPFAAKVAVLGGYPAGTYSVVVNDQPAMELTIP
jgi:hypothetical protein